MFFKKKEKYLTIEDWQNACRSMSDQHATEIHDLILKCSELESKIRLICKHEHFELSEKEKRIYYEALDNMRVDVYIKTCKCCDLEIIISKKEYLQHQKETIESSLKECE